MTTPYPGNLLWPVDWDTSTFKGRLIDLLGVSVARATMSLTPNVTGPITSQGSDAVVVPVRRLVPMTADGSFDVQIPATNDPQTSPTGWTYKVIIAMNTPGAPDWTFNIEAPVGGVVDLKTAVQSGVTESAGVRLISAYQYAKSAGFAGTETEFAQQLATGGGTGGGPSVPLDGSVTDAKIAAAGISQAKVSGLSTALAAKANKGELLINVRDHGAKGDGTTDDTAAIQAALNAAGANGTTVFVPKGRYMIDATEPATTSANYLWDEGGVSIPSNVTLRLDPAATLAAIPNNKKAYVVVRIYDKTNVTLSGGTIEGERSLHTINGTAGEWGYGIAITAGSNITIRDVITKDCWGDGINIQRIGTAVTKNVLVENVTCDNNRRQGMSIEGVDHMVVNNSTFKNTAGTGPACGVDIEPSTTGITVKHVQFNDCIFSGNAAAGMLIMGHEPLVGVSLRGCLFTGNLDSEGQFKTLTAGSDISVTGCSFTDGANAIQIAGGSNYKFDRNTVSASMVFKATSTVRGLSVTNNSFTATAGSTPYVLYSSASDVVIEGNSFDASGVTVANGTIYLAAGAASYVRFSKNRVINFPRGITVGGSGASCKEVIVADNEIDNSRIVGATVSNVTNVTFRRNIFAGTGHANQGAAVVDLGAAAVGVRLEGNRFIKEPRILTTVGLGTSRATRAVAYTSASLDLVAVGTVLEGLPLISAGAPALTAGYIASPEVRSGIGAPEGVVTAPIGTLYSRTDGTAGAILYVKESGTGSTGWVAGGGGAPTLANLPAGTMITSSSPSSRPTARTDLVVNFLTATQPTAMLAGDLWTQV